MAQVELIMPKMGESIIEATILKWVKQVGDAVEVDETILEIATDKVDSEVPSPVDGVIQEILYLENDTVAIGKVIAIIATEGEEAIPQATPSLAESVTTTAPSATASAKAAEPIVALKKVSEVGRFYSPLVKNIAQTEQINQDELDRIPGTGANGRVTKKDMLNYLKNRSHSLQNGTHQANKATSKTTQTSPIQPSPGTSVSGAVEIVEMDRMRKLIAEHMVMSKHTSPHVTSFVEVDVTEIVQWRDKVKDSFQQKYGEKITFTPIFMEAVVKAIRDFPMINISVEGNHIIYKKDINVGMATALPSGNLIVPVIKNADQYNLMGLSKQVNDLAKRARTNQLKPQEIQGGTFTLTNVGTFGNVMGTPIINQPQVAILAVGAIRKKPAVVETAYGDLIAVRQMMFLSLSYDHRVVDGFLGGSFLRRIGDYLEKFDAHQQI
ncbi:MAG: dihydrolipoamide acetyltransferase family protein [Saprospiraceae bacterium]